MEKGAWRRREAGVWGILLHRGCRAEPSAKEHPSKRCAGNFFTTGQSHRCILVIERNW